MTKITEKDQRIAELEAEVEELKKQRDENNSACLELEAEIDRLKVQLDASECTYQDAKEMLKSIYKAELTKAQAEVELYKSDDITQVRVDLNKTLLALRDTQYALKQAQAVQRVLAERLALANKDLESTTHSSWSKTDKWIEWATNKVKEGQDK